jgi:hypothetical protein
VRHSFVFYYGEEKTKKNKFEKKSRSGRESGREKSTGGGERKSSRRVCGRGPALRHSTQEREIKKSIEEFSKKTTGIRE